MSGKLPLVIQIEASWVLATFEYTVEPLNVVDLDPDITSTCPMHGITLIAKSIFGASVSYLQEWM